MRSARGSATRPSRASLESRSTPSNFTSSHCYGNSAHARAPRQSRKLWSDVRRKRSSSRRCDSVKSSASQRFLLSYDERRAAAESRVNSSEISTGHLRFRRDAGGLVSFLPASIQPTGSTTWFQGDRPGASGTSEGLHRTTDDEPCRTALMEAAAGGRKFHCTDARKCGWHKALRRRERCLDS